MRILVHVQTIWDTFQRSIVHYLFMVRRQLLIAMAAGKSPAVFGVDGVHSATTIVVNENVCVCSAAHWRERTWWPITLHGPCAWGGGFYTDRSAAGQLAEVSQWSCNARCIDSLFYSSISQERLLPVDGRHMCSQLCSSVEPWGIDMVVVTSCNKISFHSALQCSCTTFRELKRSLNS